MESYHSDRKTILPHTLSLKRMIIMILGTPPTASTVHMRVMNSPDIYFLFILSTSPNNLNLKHKSNVKSRKLQIKIQDDIKYI